HQQLVARGMSKTVVDDLEVVQIHEQHADRPAAFACGGKSVFDTVHEERSVGQASEWIVEGHVTQLLFEGLSLADVSDHGDESRRFGAWNAGDGNFEWYATAVDSQASHFAFDHTAGILGARGKTCDWLGHIG